MTWTSSLYPSDWETIALEVKEAANWTCEECGQEWSTDYRGTIALHAAKTSVRTEYAKAQNFIEGRKLEVKLPPLEQLELGGVLGLIVCLIIPRLGISEAILLL